MLMRAPTMFGRPKGDWYRIVNAGENSAEILIFDEIGFWGVTAADFARDIAAITAPEIVLRINSPGGDVFDGVAIYNAVRRHRAHVTVSIEGLAASAASLIAMAGDKITMSEAAMMMIHEPWAFAFGNRADLRAMADVLDKITGEMATIYSARSGNTRDDVLAAMTAETWLTRDEAIAAGYANAEAPAAAKAVAGEDFAAILKDFLPEDGARRMDQCRARMRLALARRG